MPWWKGCEPILETQKTLKRNKKSRTLPVILAGVVAFGGLLVYAKTVGNKIPDDQRSVQQTSGTSPKVGVESVQSAKPTENTKVTIATPRYDGSELKVDKHERVLAKGEDPYLIAINESIKTIKAVPESARAFSAKLAGDTLSVEFTPEMDKTYGTEDESALVNTLIASCEQFPTVKKLKLLVNGKSIETFGNVSLSEGLDITH